MTRCDSRAAPDRIVIFDDVGVLGGGPIQQRIAARQGTVIFSGRRPELGSELDLRAVAITFMRGWRGRCNGGKLEM